MASGKRRRRSARSRTPIRRVSSGAHRSAGRTPSARRPTIDEEQEGPYSPAEHGGGHEIGGRHVQGTGIATKLMIMMMMLMVVMVLGIAFLAANKVDEAVRMEIFRNGVMANGMLRRIGEAVARKKIEHDDLKEKFRNEEEPDPGPWIAAGRLEKLGWYLQKSDHFLPNDDIIDAIILNKQSELLASVRKPPVESFTSGRRRMIELPGLANLETEIQRGEVKLDEKVRRVVRFRQTFKTAGNRIYTAQLMLSADKIDQRVAEVRLLIFLLGLALTVVSLVFVYFVAQSITNPIHALVRDMDEVSQGNLDHVTRAQSRDEVGLLAYTFNRMTRTLAEARDAAIESERLEGELSTAREIQANLLPAKIPNLPGYDIYPFYRSAKEVGGDYYDFFPVDNEHIAILVADVSGKGIPGAIVMTQTRSAIRLLAPAQTSAAITMMKVNQVIAGEIKRGMFVTALYLILNVRTRKMTLCSAGHNPMAVWRQQVDKVELVNPNGIALGFDKGPIFNKTLQERSLQLKRGDRVVLYTDGVVEAMSPEHEEYGDQHFYGFIKRHAKMRSKDFVIELVRDLDQHKGAGEQHDDITIVTLRVS